MAPGLLFEFSDHNILRHFAAIPKEPFSLGRRERISDFTAKEQHIDFCIRMLKAAKAGDLLLKTGSFTVAECQHIDGDYSEEVQRLFRSILTSGKVIKLIADSIFVAEAARDLRWNYDIRLSGGDSYHVAMALEGQCTEFVTFDKKFKIYKDQLAKLGLKVIHANETTLLPLKYIKPPDDPDPNPDTTRGLFNLLPPVDAGK